MEKFDYLVMDIGSTYTKQRVFKNGELVATAQAPTSLENVLIGIEKGQQDLKGQLAVETIQANHVLASSSAAGGLRMVAMGYMMRVTAKAAKEVAMNSGSKILEILSNEDADDYKVQVLKEIRPDIILLAGGTDGGDEESAINNAQIIVQSEVKATVIVACNLNAQRQVASVLREGKIAYVRVPNIMPTIHELRVKESREAIHREFIKQITKAKGLVAIQQVITNDRIIPTPGAVLMAAELLAKGTYQKEGYGSLIVIDLGGATTDIHSVIPEFDELDSEERGLVVTNEKQVSYRTVEGNLGMRISAMGVIDAVDPRIILEKKGMNTKENEQAFRDYCEKLEMEPEYLPQNDLEEEWDELIAITAIEVALKRHAGRIATDEDAFKGYVPGMPMGRDLRTVKTIICVGGIFAHSHPDKSQRIVDEALKNKGGFLLPYTYKVIIDKDYMLFAGGSVQEQNKEDAFEIMSKTI